MNQNRTPRWLTILFFSVSGLVFGTSLYLITTSATASPEPVEPTVASAANSLPYTDEAQVKITLQRDTRLRLRNLEITYRGVKDGKLRLDVVLLELDPQYAYRHAIALDTASRGFRLAGINLKLRSARNTRAKLIWYRKG